MEASLTRLLAQGEPTEVHVPLLVPGTKGNAATPKPCWTISNQTVL